MALIKCPDCKSGISDSAAVCPHCGCDYRSVLREIEYLKKDIHYYETLKEPKPVSHFSGLSILLYLIAGACVLGACLIKTLAPVFLLVGGFFLLSNILALIRGDARKDTEAAMARYREAKNSIPEKKRKLAELEARFK